MKKLILLALAAVIMAGCADVNEDGSVHAPRNNNVAIPFVSTKTIDSCEYIYNSNQIAHKGNCRFCKERREKELEELVEQLKEK